MQTQPPTDDGNDDDGEVEEIGPIAEEGQQPVGPQVHL